MSRLWDDVVITGKDDNEFERWKRLKSRMSDYQSRPGIVYCVHCQTPLKVETSDVWDYYKCPKCSWKFTCASMYRGPRYGWDEREEERPTSVKLYSNDEIPW